MTHKTDTKYVRKLIMLVCAIPNMNLNINIAPLNK
jgi:hypothetical protein